MGKKTEFWEVYQNIKYDMSKATIEEINLILNNYNKGPVIENGIQYHYNIPPLAAACLNDRYKLLTGKDHPTYLKENLKALKKAIKSGDIKINNEESIFKRLKSNKITILDHNHPLNRFDIIISELETAKIEDISILLDYYNGESVLIDGVAYTPFNDPFIAQKLNNKYKELTGVNHPVYMVRVPKFINQLLKEKEELIRIGAYNLSYFDRLEQLKQDIENLAKNKQR